MNILRSISDQELQIIIDNHNCISGILGELNLSKSCKYYRNVLKERMLGLSDVKYLNNRNLKNPYSNNWTKYNDDEIFIENSKADIKTIKFRYVKINPQDKCSICKIDPLWNDKHLNFHLDHINGVNSDNRMNNLRWVCPNCHSQTETYTGRNKTK